MLDKECAKWKPNWAFSLRPDGGFLVMGESSLYPCPSSCRDGPANASMIIQWGFFLLLQVRNCAFNSALENLQSLHVLDLSFPPPFPAFSQIGLSVHPLSCIKQWVPGVTSPIWPKTLAATVGRSLSSLLWLLENCSFLFSEWAMIWSLSSLVHLTWRYPQYSASPLRPLSYALLM